jgi:hypothetical protein
MTNHISFLPFENALAFPKGNEDGSLKLLNGKMNNTKTSWPTIYIIY